MQMSKELMSEKLRSMRFGFVLGFLTAVLGFVIAWIVAV